MVVPGAQRMFLRCTTAPQVLVFVLRPRAG